MRSWMPAALHRPAPATMPTGIRSGGLGGGWLGDYLRDPGGAARALLERLREWVIEWGPIAAPPAVVGVAALVLGRRWWARRCHARLVADARQITVLAPPQVDPAGGQALWSNLVGLLRPGWRRRFTGQPHVACEYVFSEQGVAIRLWVPGVIPPGLVERAVEAAWPGSHTRVAHPATPPLPAPGSTQQRLVVGGELRLARGEALPIRSDFDADPLRALIGAPVGLGREEYAVVQILARPVAGRRVTRARRAARLVHTGGSTSLVGRLLDAITPGMKTRRPTGRRTSAGTLHSDPRTSLEYAAQNRAIVGKQRGPQYETVIRYAVATLLPADAADGEMRTARDIARGRAHALAASFASFTEHNRYARRRLRHPGPALAERRLGAGDLLSVPELGAIAHLPTEEAIPGVQRAGARAIAPPPGIATPGPAAKPLGVTDTGHQRPVALRVPDARHHLHVIGATGSGKSTLLGNMILADAEQGRGIVLIDPKGDLVTDILSRLPKSAGDRVVLFDADATSRPPCLNPLDGGETDLTVDNLVSVFRRVYSAFWGPRTDDVMRAACLTLRTQEGVATLADLPKLLADPAFRSRVTAGVSDPVLRGFWSWYEDLTDSARSQVISPLMNKLRAFLLRPFVRDAIAGGHSTVDMRDVLDGGICLVRIPKGSLGEETTRLVGSLVVARTWQATTGRARIPQRQRRDASMVIDECHNFLNLPYPIEDMLAEARGFRVAMTLAHQHLGQLPRELREGMSTNARSKIFFNASPEDARELSRHTTPRLSDHDLAHLGAYHAAARLVLNGEEAQPFTMRTQPLPRAIPGRAREIRGIARRALRDRTTGAASPTAGAPSRPPQRPGSSQPTGRRRAPAERPRTADPRRHP
ncbi:similar to Type IV secretory pathway VirD4 components [Alloactinosynnema sp. L-07]|uniref:type IV secretory system conjugative DNA transfer family protein n=1 Tax=Alloactinosynnema sp. L-07 TaxID=1653480 RepID=UPI00065EFC47|nr:type IV secretory system conjugative DNA transfer family protein [Alloactinosynnema sp. L-07]CRK57609.1 similar to Type IV secretory pathway VirD4 components [Alloactinosynnema sp. L-07]